jgi:hypothetical protein
VKEDLKYATSLLQEKNTKSRKGEDIALNDLLITIKIVNRQAHFNKSTKTDIVNFLDQLLEFLWYNYRNCETNGETQTLIKITKNIIDSLEHDSSVDINSVCEEIKVLLKDIMESEKNSKRRISFQKIYKELSNKIRTLMGRS